MEDGFTHPTIRDANCCEVTAMAAQVDAATAVCATSIRELRRQHHAMTKRRGDVRSADAANYALGAGLSLVGCTELDDTALVGLMAQPDRMLAWLQQAREAGAGPMFGDLVKAVFADAAYFAWCRQWGRIIQWRRRKSLYEASTASFLASGKTRAKARWRAEEVTEDQAALIATLVHILSVPVPTLANRGEAFEWIHERNGNPAYWAEPKLPLALG